MVFAMLAVSMLLEVVRLASKILTIRHIDLFLTNRQQCFQQTHAIDTGISDFRKMVVTVMKIHNKKEKVKNIIYRNNKHFHEQSFDFELNNELLKIDINNAEIKEFNEIFLKVVDKHAPRK